MEGKWDRKVRQASEIIFWLGAAASIFAIFAVDDVWPLATAAFCVLSALFCRLGGVR